jgi:outer membrane protein OmpA-like peptidoglycan-associated protein
MMDHSLQLNTLGLVFVRHNVPYTPRRPIDRVPSKIYTGIIIDARGELPVHGEFITSPAYPCLFPAVRDETMDLLYEKNMMNSSGARANGIAAYAWSDDETLYRDRIGVDPLRISARKIFGVNKTDPVISRSDALKILSVPENIKLLEEGRIVILLDKDKLIYSVAALQNDLDYYVTYREVVDYYYANKLPDVSVHKDQKGIQISVQNIRFQPDSDEILPDEKDRLDTIAKSLKNAVKDSGFTITVEGHTANVGKPEGEMRLSIERAETIVDEFVKRGIDRSLFTYKGYGGTIPVADNTTDEGRSQNRRVEINVMPIQTYIRRAP